MIPNTMRQYIVLTCFALLVSACGTKGQLTLPPGPVTPPLLGNPAPAPNTAAKPADDNNKATEAKK